MLYYIIKSIHKYIDKKTGNEQTLISYYERTSGVGGLYFNCMGGMETAKQFDCKSEAKRVAERLFRKGKFEIVKITQ